jgi:hypothetical protein
MGIRVVEPWLYSDICRNSGFIGPKEMSEHGFTKTQRARTNSGKSYHLAVERIY